jgi:hypothetical protein
MKMDRLCSVLDPLLFDLILPCLLGHGLIPERTACEGEGHSLRVAEEDGRGLDT